MAGGFWRGAQGLSLSSLTPLFHTLNSWPLSHAMEVALAR